MNKKQKKMLIRIVIAAVLVVAFSLIPMKGYVKFVLFMSPYLVIGYDILKKMCIRDRPMVECLV